MIQMSVIICTYNRDKLLPKVLNSLVNQYIDPHIYEIIIVNNSSTDNTNSVAMEFIRKFSEHRIRLIQEPRLGLSYARNTGYKSAKGRFVAYIDDDAVASINWCKTILDVFHNVKPTPGILTGKIKPVFPTAPPPWLSDSLSSLIGNIDYSDEPKFLERSQGIGGGNSAYPKYILEKIGGFPSELGRVGNRLISNEDIFVKQRIEDIGYRCYYHPKMEIQHYIEAKRLKQKWFLKRFFWQGISNTIMQNSLYSKHLNPTERLVVESKILSKIAFLLNLSNIISFLFPTQDPKRFTKKCYTYQAIGEIWAYILTVILQRTETRQLKTY